MAASQKNKDNVNFFLWAVRFFFGFNIFIAAEGFLVLKNEI